MDFVKMSKPKFGIQPAISVLYEGSMEARKASRVAYRAAQVELAAAAKAAKIALRGYSSEQAAQVMAAKLPAAEVFEYSSLIF